MPRPLTGDRVRVRSTSGEGKLSSACADRKGSALQQARADPIHARGDLQAGRQAKHSGSQHDRHGKLCSPYRTALAYQGAAEQQRVVVKRPHQQAAGAGRTAVACALHCEWQ